MNRLLSLAVSAVVVVGLAACTTEQAGRVKPLSDEAKRELAAKGMRVDAPIFVRIFKQEAELEVWKDMGGGQLALFKTYPICAWSGNLGPKQREGDRQAPEGFYVIAPSQLNPNSQFHLAFNLGYPNAYDRSFGRTGDYLMVHGDCSSRGCYAMTNPQIEEIYALAVEAFRGGQERFAVHAFPFRMHEVNMAKFASHQWIDFWRNIKQGYDLFEATGRLPSVGVQNRRYVFAPGSQSVAATAFASGSGLTMIYASN
jgi:murein L,D-transpeptidase YafK